jgi:Tfp pilus assembly protein FimT
VLIKSSELIACNGKVKKADIASAREASARLASRFIRSAGSSWDNSNYWEQGWIVFDDSNQNSQVDAGETVRVFYPLKDGYSLSPNVNSNSLRFYPDGRVRRASKALPLMTFRLCAPSAADGNLKEYSREIVINATGRMRLQFGREIAGAC